LYGFGQAFRSEVSVAHDGEDAFVTQQLLNLSEVNSRHDQATGKRVPKAVPGEVGNSGLLAGLRKPLVRQVNGEDIRGITALP